MNVHITCEGCLHDNLNLSSLILIVLNSLKNVIKEKIQTSLPFFKVVQQ